jgi:hypothetical protein
MSPLDMTASELLAIPVSMPERIFQEPTYKHGEMNFDKQFLKFVTKWHPDICKDTKAQDVMIHLNLLHGVPVSYLSYGPTRSTMVPTQVPQGV